MCLHEVVGSFGFFNLDHTPQKELLKDLDTPVSSDTAHTSPFFYPRPSLCSNIMAETTTFTAPLSQGFGYGIIVGLGFAFALLMIFITWALKRYVFIYFNSVNATSLLTLYPLQLSE